MSDRQLLTILSQLYKGIHGKPRYHEEWLNADYDNRGDLFDYETVSKEVNELAEKWMDEGLDPAILLKERIGGTISFLRKHIEGWREYEIEYDRKRICDRAVKFLGTSGDLVNAAKELNELLQLEPAIDVAKPEELTKKLKEAATLLDVGDVISKETADTLMAIGGTLPDEKFVHHYIKELEAFVKRERELVNKHFPKIAKQDRPFWPKGWMEKNKGIREAMATKIGKRRIQLFNELWNYKMNVRDSEKMRERVSSSIPPKERTRFNSSKSWPLLVQVDMEFYAKKIGNVGAETVRGDIKKLVKAGALVRFGKPGPNEHSVYAIGKYKFIWPDGNKMTKFSALIKAETPQINKRLAEALR